MNDAADRLTIKANLSLSKEEIIDRIVDMEMDPLRAERNKAGEASFAAHHASDTAQIHFNDVCAKLDPRSLLTPEEVAALDSFVSAFRLDGRSMLCIANLAVMGKLMSGVLYLAGENSYHQTLRKLVNVATPTIVAEAYEDMAAKRRAFQDAQQAYSLASSKCDEEAVGELRKAIKNRLVDNLFKEINGSLQKLLAAPADEAV